MKPVSYKQAYCNGGIIAPMSSHKLKSFFLLDPDVIFLNHGSFGACPRPVFRQYQAWQRQLERQPVQFIGRDMKLYDQQARQVLGDYINAAADDLVFIPNATYGVNIIARSLHLKPGDEILTSNHEYGACNNTWTYISKQSGVIYKQQTIPLPVTDEAALLDQIWQAVTDNTRVIYISHITSPTALRMPVEAICKRARQAGLISVIDGAHAPGQISLDMQAIGADFYTGNCHKWMLSPKGAAFLYTRKDMQPLVEPLVVSWGYNSSIQNGSGSRYRDLLAWTGTHDPAAALSVPAAIEFMHKHHWPAVRETCKKLLTNTLARISEMSGMTTAYPLGSNFYSQMAVARLPDNIDFNALHKILHEQRHIEVPLVLWNNSKLMRISVQAYNTEQELDTLVEGIEVGLRHSG